MVGITLNFVTDRDTVFLNRTTFTHPLLPQDLVTVRGATAPPGIGNFRWSNGVRALSVLLVRHALLLVTVRSQAELSAEPATIEGTETSLAASLDYALSKQPVWLQDMFGNTRQGTSIAKLLIRRINPDRKRSGPVVLFISNSSLEVIVRVDGSRVNSAKELQRLVEVLERVGCVV